MRPFLKNLVRNSSDDLARLDQLAARLESRGTLLEQLLQQAEGSIAQLQKLEAFGQRVSTVERQLTAVEAQADALAAVESRLAGLAQSHTRFETQLGESTAAVGRLGDEIASLRTALTEAGKLREGLDGLLAVDGPLKKIQADTEALAGQVQGHRADLGVLKEEHGLALEQHRTASGRLEAFHTDWQVVTGRVSEVEHRLAGLEQLSADLAPTAETIAQTKRQLAAARAAADQIGQRMAVLDRQRDGVDQAMAKLDRLTTLMAEADAGLERHTELARQVTQLAAQLGTATADQSRLTERARALSDQLDGLGAGQATAERGLRAVRERLDRQTERLAAEERGLERVSKGSAELREVLSEAGRDLASFTEQSAGLVAAAAQAETLGARVSSLSAELARLSELAGQIAARCDDASRLQGVLEGLGSRLDRVEGARPMLDQAIRHLVEVTAGQEGIQHALEEVRSGREEVARGEQELRRAAGFIAETQRAVALLRDEVPDLDRMRGMVDGLRREVERLTEAQDSVEARRGQVEALEKRVAEATALGASVEERSRSLIDGLSGAEERLGSLLPRVGELARAGGQLESLASDARALQERLGAVDGRMSALEQRSADHESLAARMETIAREADRREEALQRASAHLERATTLRLEAAQVAESLTERAREVAGQLEHADERLASLNGLSRDLEVKIAGLDSMQNRLTSFESKLAEWRGVEQQLAQALEHAASRRVTITALETEFRGLHDLAGRVLGDARAVAEAQPEWAQARADLDQVLERLKDMDGKAELLESRRRQVEAADERLAYAGALMDDLRSSLEILVAEKAQLDHLFDRAAALPLETRRLEALIETLREERRVTERVRGAVAELRQREVEAEAEVAEG